MKYGLLALALLAALSALEAWRLGNPDAAPADAPADQFSATRAITALHTVSLDQPHPLGTPAHDVVRDRIAAAFTALDYRVEQQHTFACNAHAVCAEIDNVIARLPGQPGAHAVVVAAHYDSVPAGPGASDDGTGVASALEIARAIRHDSLANPVVFLIDDGEEAGLLGAEGYIADAQRSADAAFIINVEARGTTGTPFLFETSRDNRWLISELAGALPHPVTTSLFATIYDLLPNDTDLTVFKRAGRAGINFAYLGGGTQYHTPLDNFANVDAGSVQRRGDQVLAMVRTFAARLDSSPGDAVWFDAFAAVIIWWPAGWTLWIAIAALLLVGVAIVRGRASRALSLGGVAIGVASFVATAALALGLGFALTRLFALRAPGALFSPHPGPMLAAAWLAGIAAGLAACGLARRSASFDAMIAGHAIAWNGLAIAVAVLLPGAAYIVVVPGAVLAVLAVLRATVGAREELVGLLALVAAATVFLPFALVGYDALGDTSVAMAAVMLALVTSTFAPMVDRPHGRTRWLILALVVLAGIAAGIAMLVPSSSAAAPAHLPLSYVRDADAGTSQWQVDRVDHLQAAASFSSEKQLVSPWFGSYGRRYVAPAAAAQLAPPDAKVTSQPGDPRQITLDVSSARQAPRLAIAWHTDAEVTAIRINGVALPPPPARFHSYLAPGWHGILLRGSTAHIEISQRGPARAEAIIADTSFGLPDGTAAMVQARNASGAVPVHDGDVTIVQRHVTW